MALNPTSLTTKGAEIKPIFNSRSDTPKENIFMRKACVFEGFS